ncbi:MAG: hypothetical protein IKR25_04120, partial [Muribaculaceae bacterium]|nr:hypothetical protein [Muribaculaceae bacterium]
TSCFFCTLLGLQYRCASREVTPHLGSAKSNSCLICFALRSVCTTVGCAEGRRQLGNAKAKNFVFCFALRSLCTTVALRAKLRRTSEVQNQIRASFVLHFARFAVTLQSKSKNVAKWKKSGKNNSSRWQA